MNHRIAACAVIVAIAGHALAQESKPVVKEQPVAKEPPAAAPAPKEAPKPKIDEKATKLYTDSNEALKKLKSLSYDIEMKMSGPMAAMAPSAKASVQIGRVDGAMIGKYRIKGEMQAPGAPGAQKIDLGNDGETIRSINHAEKTLAEGKYDKDVPHFEQGMELMMFEFFQAEPLPDEGVVEIRMGADQKVGDVNCKVVEVIMLAGEAEEGQAGGPTMTMRRIIGEKDLLPRKVEFVLPAMPGADKADANMQVVEYTNLVADQVKEEVFKAAKPEGYTVKELPKANDDMPEAKFKVGDEAGDFTLKTSKGEEFKLSAYRGKVVVLDFWATWCGPCKRAMPGLQKLHEEMKDKGVVVVGVNIADESEKAVKFMDEKKYTYTLLLSGDPVAEQYGVQPIPQFFVVGVDGKVIHHAVGFNPSGEEEMKKKIEEHLAKTKK
jgi:peroxiredoxin